MNNSLTTSDLRLSNLSTWVAAQMRDEGATSPSDLPIKLTPLGGDAGFRRYFRFQVPSKWLAVDAPPASEDSHLFVQLAEALRKCGLRAPDIRAVDYENGWLLVEDFGDQLLIKQSAPPSHVGSHFYSTSFENLLALQGCTPKLQLPHYDQTLLTKELALFGEWFVGKLLGYSLTAPEQAIIENFFEPLVKSALEQPQVFVHRDFHSRNLMCIDSSKLGILDFQGAVWGPCTYDLVSLLRDCYLRWPANQVDTWALNYRDMSVKAGLLSNQVAPEVYSRWFDWMGLQRHIKVLGIFARLNLRDNKPHYLADLPLVIRYVLEVCCKYPQFSDFYRLFLDKLLPLAQKQHWYSDWKTAGDRL